MLLILDGYDEYSFAKKQLECDELRGPRDFQLEIQGFKSWKRKEGFAKKFLADEEDLDEFKLYLENKDLVGMAEIPLLLLMLCTLWKEKRHEGLPKSRADIFIQFIQTMLDHKGEIQLPMPFQKMTSTEARKTLVILERLPLKHFYKTVFTYAAANSPAIFQEVLKN